MNRALHYRGTHETKVASGYSPHVPTGLLASTGPDPEGRIDSWKEIARYLNRTVRTVQRWETSERLPVHRRISEDKGKGQVYAYKSELDVWMSGGPPISEGSPRKPTSREFGLLSSPWSVALLVGLGISAAAWLSLRARAPNDLGPHIVQLTDFAGSERYPAFSPDAQKMTFSWSPNSSDGFNLYLRSLPYGTPERLTNKQNVDDISSTWSPDGKYVAFIRKMPPSFQSAAIVIPSGGGPERTVATFPNATDVDSAAPTLSWTADGKWLIVPSNPAQGFQKSLALISPDTLVSRALTDKPGGSEPDCCPSLSPDGHTLAFLRSPHGAVRRVFIASLNNDNSIAGEPRKLTDEPSGALRPIWTDHGRSVLYVTNKYGSLVLSRAALVSPGEAKEISLLPPNSTDWALAPEGRWVAYSEAASRAQIWRMDLKNSGQPSSFISSSSSDAIDPQFSPDGSKIAFVSVHARESDIWIAKSDGTDSVKVAHVPLRRIAPPRWSPDGMQIVFECIEGGNQDICKVPMAGGKVMRVTANPGDNTLPSWSHDGRWIYFTSDRSGTSQVWKIPANGNDSDAVQLTREGGFGAVESLDGKTIYYVNDLPTGAIRKTPSSGGTEIPLGIRSFGPPGGLAVTGQGLYYPQYTDPAMGVEIWEYIFRSGKAERVGSAGKRIVRGVAISPDSRYLLYSPFDLLSGDIYELEIASGL